MFKKITIVALVLMLAGCSSFVSDEDFAAKNEPKAVMQSGFNEECYIWESFQFPTNRTSGIQ